jgi:hypothetical protein
MSRRRDGLLRAGHPLVMWQRLVGEGPAANDVGAHAGLLLSTRGNRFPGSLPETEVAEPRPT